MLDALKFAFEILIVGTLALPWIAVLIRMFSSDSAATLDTYLEVVPEPAKSAVTIAFVIAFGYLLGSSVSRFSKDFFNDEMWQPAPTEDLIRDDVYRDEYCRAHVYDYVHFPFVAKHSVQIRGFCPNIDTKSETVATAGIPDTSPEPGVPAVDQAGFDENVQEFFRLQESALLLRGHDKVDRLKQYYDQIIVLRGAAFNGAVWFALGIFGCCGNLRAYWSGNRLLKWLPVALPGATILLSLWKLWLHWSQYLHDGKQTFYNDPPLAEIVVLTLGILGLFVTLRAQRIPSYLRSCVLAAVITGMAVGGWWWTEVLYDLQIIHSLPELGQEPGTSPHERLKDNPSESAPEHPMAQPNAPKAVPGATVGP